MIIARRAFSLIEVVIALALFSTGVVAILGLMGSLAGRSKEVEESATALNLPAAVESVLRSKGSNDIGEIRSFIGNTDSHLIANHSGDRVTQGSGTNDKSIDAYYRIDFSEMSSPEFNDVEDLLVPLIVTVSWPYKPKGSTSPTPLGNRSTVSFSLAISQ